MCALQIKHHLVELLTEEMGKRSSFDLPEFIVAEATGAAFWSICPV